MLKRCLRGILALFVLLTLVSCGARDEEAAGRGQGSAIPAAAHGKVVLIGLDGASWNVMLPLVRNGKMPNIAKLMENGSWGNLLSDPPTMSPVIWTSIVTGVKRDAHGIKDFVVKLPGKYDSTLITSNLRQRKALWNIVSDNGMKTGFINWWASWPAEPVNGFVVSNNMFYLPLLEGKDQKGGGADFMTYPQNIYSEIDGLRKPGSEELHRELENIFGSKERVQGFTTRGSTQGLDPESSEFKINLAKYTLQSTTEIEIGLTEIGEHLYARYNPDLFGLYYEGIDIASHQWWKYMEPVTERWKYDVSAEDVNKYGAVLQNYYAFTDRMLGRLLDGLDSNTTVVVVSDHGFHAKPPDDAANIFKLNKLFAELGYLVFKDENNEEIDYSKTKIVDYAHSEFWGRQRNLYVNLKGRDPMGVVGQGTEFQAFIEEMINTLMSLRTESGNPVFLDVSVPEGSASIPNSVSPDLIASVNSRLKPGEVIKLGGKKFQVKDFFLPRPASGSHDDNGILIVSGPDIKKKHEVKGATIFDVTPTILYILGLPTSQDMDGSVLEDVFAGDYLAKHPIKQIASYETGEGASGSDKPMQSDVDESIKERLKSLGYVQ